MSAEVLREAAALMRERAEAATPGPWAAENAPNGFPPVVIGDGMAVAETFDKPRLFDAQHIASWHPDVALAVSGWLESVAERQKPTSRSGRRSHGWTGSREANAVARAYLGSTS